MAIDEAAPPQASAPQTGDAAVAEALAQQVTASADGVTWRKLTTLLDLFGAYRLTSEVRNRVAHALASRPSGSPSAATAPVPTNRSARAPTRAAARAR
jgi:hypothetical protein